MSSLNQGLKNNVRSPSSIPNQEHNDAAAASKNINGSGGVMSSIVADSTVTTPIASQSVLRISNTTASWAFVYIGLISAVPGSCTALNSLAIAPNSTDLFFAGRENLLTADSQCVKASVIGVQVALLQS